MLKLYRAALHLYPGEFRDEYGRELALVLRDRLRDEPGRAARAWIWVHAFTGILIEAPLEHLRLLSEDTRYALRLLSRERGMALGAIVMLTLGIGSATLVFSLANGVLLRPLPFPEPHRLVAIDEQNPADRRYDGTIPFPNFVDLRARARSFVDMGVYADGKTAIRGTDGNEPVVLAAVSEGFFATTGVHPVAGRTFTGDELRPKGPGVIVLSWNLYERRFGSNPAIVGTPLETVDGLYTIVGVMPRGFHFPDRTDAWVPLQMDPAGPRTDYYLTAIGRVKDGVAIAQADAEVAALIEGIKQTHPPNNGWRGRALPLRDVLAQSYRPVVLTLAVAAALLLAIACANVGHLLLVRASARTREIAVRTALGATRRRLLRQLVTEGLTLGTIGGIAGAWLARISLPALLALIPVELPPWLDCSMDGRVLAFAIGVSLLTSLAFGSLPALNLSRRSILSRLTDAGRSTTTSAGQQRLRHALIVVELSVALTLLAGATLTARSFIALRGQPLGYETRTVLSMSLDYPPDRYPDGVASRALVDRLRQDLSSLPGVTSVGLTSGIPLNSTWGRLYTPEGHEKPLEAMSFANHIVVTPGFFRTLGLSLMQGRDFSDADFDSLNLVVSHDFAAEYFPAGALGKRVRFGSPKKPEPWFTIVGVVADSRHASLRAKKRYNLYLPYGRERSASSLLIRSGSDGQRLAPAVTAAIRAIDREIAAERVLTLEQLADHGAWQDRFMAALFSSFAVLALALTAGGFYAVLAYAVTLRRHEIGVRMALGASPADVRRMVAGQAVRLAAAGLAAGLAAAAAVGAVLQPQLYQVSALDPVTFVVAPVVLVLTALASAIIPARRATRVDPIIALRHE